MLNVNESIGVFTAHNPRLSQADIEFTSKCNLRCTYCTVSLPNDVGVDLDPASDESVLDQLKALGVERVTLNGRGETTSLPEWTNRVRPFIENFWTRIISNFARPLTDAEADLLSDVGRIHVSIDSTDRELMRVIRRRANPDTVIANILRVRIAAMRRGKKPPEITLSVGVYDRNVLTLPDVARLAVVLGDIAEVDFWNLVKYEDLENAVNVRSLNDMDLDEQIIALAALEETSSILSKAHIPYFFAGNFFSTLQKNNARRGELQSGNGSELAHT